MGTDVVLVLFSFPVWAAPEDDNHVYACQCNGYTGHLRPNEVFLYLANAALLLMVAIVLIVLIGPISFKVRDISFYRIEGIENLARTPRNRKNIAICFMRHIFMVGKLSRNNANRS